METSSTHEIKSLDVSYYFDDANTLLKASSDSSQSISPLNLTQHDPIAEPNNVSPIYTQVKSDLPDSDVRELINQHNAYGKNKPSNARKDIEKYCDPNFACFEPTHQFANPIRQSFMDSEGAVWIRDSRNNISVVKGSNINAIHREGKIKWLDEQIWIGKSVGRFYSNNGKELTEYTLPEFSIFERIHQDITLKSNSNYILYSLSQDKTWKPPEDLDLEKSELKKAQECIYDFFDSEDTENSGFLDQTQLKMMLIRLFFNLGRSLPTDLEVGEYMKKYDTNGDGKISLKDYEALYSDWAYQMLQTQNEDRTHEINLTDLKNALDVPIFDEDESCNTDYVTFGIFSRKNLEHCAEIQVSGLKRLEMTCHNQIFAMSNLGVVLVWQISNSNEAIKTYQIDPRPEVFDILSNIVCSNRLCDFQNVGCFFNFQTKSFEQELAKYVLKMAGKKKRKKGASPRKKKGSKKQKIKNNRTDKKNSPIKKKKKRSFAIIYKEIWINEEYVALFWKGQNPQVDLISLNSLESKLSLLGNFTQIGLNKSFLILYNNKEIEYIDVARKWWERTWLLHLENLNVSKIIWQSDQDTIYLVMGKDLVDYRPADYPVQYSNIVWRQLCGLQYAQKEIGNLKFIGKYAVAMKGNEGFFVINLRNYEKPRYIQRKWAGFTCTKQFIIGYHAEQLDELENYISEVYFFDPASCKVNLFERYKTQQGKGSLALDVLSNDYAFWIVYKSFDGESETVQLHPYMMKDREFYKSESTSFSIETFNQIKHKITFGNNMKIACTIDDLNNPPYAFIYDVLEQKKDIVHLVNTESAQMALDQIKHLHPTYTITLSFDLRQVHLYDVKDNELIAQMKFTDKIIHTYLSQDKKELYVLSRHADKKPTQNLFSEEQIESLENLFIAFYDYPSESNLDALFRQFYVRGNGEFITKTRFEHVMRAFVGNACYFQIVQMFNEADEDCDGLIDKSQLRNLLTSNNLLTMLLHDTDEVVIHVLNFKMLRSTVVYRTTGAYTKIHVAGNQLVLFDELNWNIRMIPIEHCVDKRFYTFAKNLKNKPDQIMNDSLWQEFKGITIIPSYINMTHFCTHYKAYDALEQLLDEGYKITETADKTSALSMLLKENENTHLDRINRMIQNIINDEILINIDQEPCNVETSIKITQHLKPVQRWLKALNETKVPNLNLIYWNSLMSIEPKDLKIVEEVVDQGETCFPKKDLSKENHITQNIKYLVSVMKIEWDIRSEKTYSIIDAALKDTKILESEVIRLFTLICWRQAQRYVAGFGLLFLWFTVLMTIHIITLRDKSVTDLDQFWIVSVLMIFQLIASAYSAYEIYKDKLSYFRDFWNIVDVLAHVFTLLYLVSYLNKSDLPTIILALSNWFLWWRLISFVRVIGGARYYIRMIIEIIKGMRYFGLILMLCVMAQSLSLMALRQEDYYYIYYMVSYRLMYGDFEEPEFLDTHGERAFFVMSSLVITLVMLNVIIAIMGDEYDKFQSKQEILDIREQLKLMREVGKFLSCFNSRSKPRYIHWITSELISERDTTKIWEGKVNEIRRHLVNSELKMIEKIDKLEIKMSEQMENQSEALIDSENKIRQELRQSEMKIRAELRDFKEDIITILDSRLRRNENDPVEERQIVNEGHEQPITEDTSSLQENDKLIQSRKSRRNIRIVFKEEVPIPKLQHRDSTDPIQAEIEEIEGLQEIHGHHVIHVLDSFLHVYDITDGSAKNILIPMRAAKGDLYYTWVYVNPNEIMLMGLQSHNDEGYKGCAYVNLQTEDFTTKSNMISDAFRQNPVWYWDKVWIFQRNNDSIPQVYSCKEDKWAQLPKAEGIEDFTISFASEINGIFWLYGMKAADFTNFNPNTGEYTQLKDCNMPNNTRKILIKQPNSFIMIYENDEGAEYDLNGQKILGGYKIWEHGQNPQGEVIQYGTKAYFTPRGTLFVLELDFATKNIHVVYEFIND